MTRAELEEIIHNGEGSGVEFKLDGIENYDLAKEVVALAVDPPVAPDFHLYKAVEPGKDIALVRISSGRGMGTRNKVIPGMLAHNGTEPEFMENDWSFTVKLLKGPRP